MPVSDATIVAEVVSYQIVANRPVRLLVALWNADGRWVSFGNIDLAFSFLGDRTSTAPPDVVLAATSATFLAIPGTPDDSEGRPTLTLPANGRGVYEVEALLFPRAGYWQVNATGTLDDDTPIAAQAVLTVLVAPTVVAVGDPAPMTDSPVMGDPSLSLEAIDSRAVGGQPVPDPELHVVSIADAMRAGHPLVVVFSTPVYCTSRFCGPVTDLIAELASKYADRADFVHVEIYRSFETGDLNQSVSEWLMTPDGELREPWTFLVGADGRIAGSWDTIVTRGELEPLLDALPRKG